MTPTSWPSTPTETARFASASLRPAHATTARYYQAVVDAAEEFSAENGLGEVIVVDNIQAADAATELENLAQQPVDIMIVGASEIAEPMADLAEQYSDIFWYCNCGAGFPPSEFYLQSQDNGAGIAYTAGCRHRHSAARQRRRCRNHDRLL